MIENWVSVPGIVIAGHKVASGPSEKYPYGSLEKQIPYFKSLGLNLEKYHKGTINISVAPKGWVLKAPEYMFRKVAWTDLHPPEDFSFSACKISFDSMDYQGWIYFPHPETKIRHFQDPNIIEVITEWIQELHYGSKIIIELKTSEVVIMD